MEWYIALLIIVGSLLVMMATGMPVAFAFLLLNVIGMFLWWGGEAGLRVLSVSIYQSITSFTLLPLALFILMGEVMFHSGVAPLMINTVNKWLGRLSGRLGLVAVGSGTLLAFLTGSSIGSVAVLSSTLVPEMEKQGYKKPMSLGPILGSGGLAMMIPPSGLAVLLGAIAEISIGRILIGIIIPGLLMAVLYAVYIIGRCRLQPSIAPAYDVPHIPLKEKIIDTVRYILPLGFIIFLVVGVILIGIATPSEAAATGALSTFILAAIYKRMNWQVAKKTLSGSLQVTIMIFMILVGAKAFGQVLARSGASAGFVQFVTTLPLPPMPIFIGLLFIIFIMGMFINEGSIMLITLPLFMPVIRSFGFDPAWFAVVYLIVIETACTSPPFGLSLFVMKGAAPSDTTMGDIYRAALPFIYCDFASLALVIAFPVIALWLPSLMMR